MQEAMNIGQVHPGRPPLKTHSARCFGKPCAGPRPLGLACALTVFFMACGAPALAQSGGAPKFHEYEVKAAFLFNFMQFVEWPANAATNAKSPLWIGVLGEDPFGNALAEAIEGETILGRPLALKRGRQIADLKDCHLIFVCRSERVRLGEILAALRGHSALTVSDTDQFCEHGGMIGLINEGGRIRFDINLEAAEQCNLKISSKLLRLGRLTAK